MILLAIATSYCTYIPAQITFQSSFARSNYFTMEFLKTLVDRFLVINLDEMAIVAAYYS